MKKCFKCERLLPRSDFYTHPRMGDGLLGKCKRCTRRDVRENRVARAEHYASYDRAREAAGFPRRRNRRGPAQRRAGSAISNAVHRGKMTKPDTCADCGVNPGSPLDGHHEDYTKPLEVLWLCRKCHGKRHRMDREEAA